MGNGELPLVVCVTSDVAVRERVVRKLDNFGTVVMCSDLSELKAMLFPSSGSVGTEPQTNRSSPIVVGDLAVDPAHPGPAREDGFPGRGDVTAEGGGRPQTGDDDLDVGVRSSLGHWFFAM